MTAAETLQTLAERIRSSGVLGRSSLTQRLFDYLIECSLKDKAPKEIEVAIDAFGRGDGFDVSQDAVVRVYIHKLRRKLDEFYAGPGKDEANRIAIPRGEYRLVVVPQTTPVVDESVTAPEQGKVPWVRWAVGLLVVSLVLNLAMLLSGSFSVGRAVDPVAEVRGSSVWAPLLDDQLPIYVVVGDYYIFGEVDEFLSVKRLIRDFAINSRADFERALQNVPEFQGNYEDLNLGYLPTASAYALRDVMPILATAGPRVRLILASEINVDVLKSGHIVYLGFFSGMGSTLQEVVFAGSRLATGASYDELYDIQTDTEYVSDVGSVQGRLKYRDYGYFSSFPGPGANQFIIIAGTRDIAVMRAAEIATHSATLDELKAQTTASAFEALYEVYGFERTDIDAKLEFASPLDTTSIWREAEPR